MIDLRERDDQWIMARAVGLDEPFSRSNGTILARLYERLTKASRRRAGRPVRLAHGEHNIVRIENEESAYRQGVYDAFKALQEELEG